MMVGLSLAAKTCRWPPDKKGDSRMGLVPNTTFLWSVGAHDIERGWWDGPSVGQLVVDVIRLGHELLVNVEKWS